MKNILRQLILLLAVPAFLCAQIPDLGDSVNLYDYFESGDGIEGFNVPFYDEDNVRQANLYCGYAKLLDNELVDVTNIRIDVYDEGKVIMTIYAPQCFASIDQAVNEKMLKVHSEGDVLIEMEQMSIVGKGFRFSSEQNKFEILSDSRVLIRESARSMDGVEL